MGEPSAVRGFLAADNAYFDMLFGQVSPTAHYCLMYLVRNTVGYHRPSVRLSFKQIGDALGIARNTAMRALGELETLHIVASDDRPRGRTQTRTYTTMPPEAWTLPARPPRATTSAKTELVTTSAENDLVGETSAENALVVSKIALVAPQTSAKIDDAINTENLNTVSKDKETDADASGATAGPSSGVAVPVSDPVAIKAKREPRYSGEEQAYVRELVDRYKGRLRVKKLSAEGKERGAAHWFYHAGPDGEPVPVDVVMHVYDLMKARRFWQGKLLSLQKVAEQFPEYANDPVAFAAEGGAHLRPLASRDDVTQASVPPLPATDAGPLPEPEPEPLRRFNLAGYREDARTWRAVADELRASMTRQQFDTAFGGAHLWLPPKGAPPGEGDAAPLPTLVLHSRASLELMPRYAGRIADAFRHAAPKLAGVRWVCRAEVVMEAETTDSEPPPAA